MEVPVDVCFKRISEIEVNYLIYYYWINIFLFNSLFAPNSRAVVPLVGLEGAI